ncbi:MAG: zf-HC2 domain-containing protein [Nitriliruptorales bacterium]
MNFWRRLFDRGRSAPPATHDGPPGGVECREVARVLQTYLDGELDQRTAEKAAEHLEACRRCGLEADTYRQLKEALAKRAEPVDVEALERLRAFTQELAEGSQPL